MFEFSNNPAFFPALYGFLGGFVLVALIASIRGRIARSTAHAAEKSAGNEIAKLTSDKSALKNEIAKLRSNEARLVKHQGQLEGLAKSDTQKERELSRLVKATRDSFQSGLETQQKVILDAISAIAASRVTAPVPPTPVIPGTSGTSEDLDFVPIENLPRIPGTSTSREGFVADQSAAKAESAANAFRAALNDDIQ